MYGHGNWGCSRHSQVGVHVSIIGDVLFHPLSIDEECEELLKTTFDLEMVPFSIGGSTLLGSLLRGNKNGIAVADIATEQDLDRLTSFGEVVIMESGVNAAGNLIACNNHGAVVGMTIPGPGCDLISEILGVPSTRVRISGQDFCRVGISRQRQGRSCTSGHHRVRGISGLGGFECPPDGGYGLLRLAIRRCRVYNLE